MLVAIAWSVQRGSSSRNGSQASIPLAGRAHFAAAAGMAIVFVRGCAHGRPRASSRSIGAPRLHEWIARTVPIFSTIRISSRVAPMASAARICDDALPWDSGLCRQRSAQRRSGSTNLRGDARSPRARHHLAAQPPSAGPTRARGPVLHSKDLPPGDESGRTYEPEPTLLICFLPEAPAVEPPVRSYSKLPKPGRARHPGVARYPLEFPPLALRGHA